MKRTPSLLVAVMCFGMIAADRIFARDIVPISDQPYQAAPTAAPAPSASPADEPPKIPDVLPPAPARSGGDELDAKPSEPLPPSFSPNALPQGGATSSITPPRPSWVVGNERLPFPGSLEYLEYVRERRRQSGVSPSTSAIGESKPHAPSSVTAGQTLPPAAKAEETKPGLERTHLLSGTWGQPNSWAAVLDVHVDGTAVWGEFGPAGGFKGEFRDGKWQVYWVRNDLQCGGTAELIPQDDGNELLVYWVIDAANSIGGLDGKGTWRFRRVETSPSAPLEERR